MSLEWQNLRGIGKTCSKRWNDVQTINRILSLSLERSSLFSSFFLSFSFVRSFLSVSRSCENASLRLGDRNGCMREFLKRVCLYACACVCVCTKGSGMRYILVVVVQAFAIVRLFQDYEPNAERVYLSLLLTQHLSKVRPSGGVCKSVIFVRLATVKSNGL